MIPGIEGIFPHLKAALTREKVGSARGVASQAKRAVRRVNRDTNAPLEQAVVATAVSIRVHSVLLDPAFAYNTNPGY